MPLACEHLLKDSPLTQIDNAKARAVFLDRHGLWRDQPGTAPETVLTRLGFIQVDSIPVAARAHDMILWARAQSARQHDLPRMLERGRCAFEHWTHDASILPMSRFVDWRHKFAADEVRLQQRWADWRRDGFMERLDPILRRIADTGPVSTSDIGQGEARSPGGWWDWNPSKTALEFLWRRGDLMVTRRENFRKVYDLTERVVPPEYLNARRSWDETRDRLNQDALGHLGFANGGEIARFWDVIASKDANMWLAQQPFETATLKAATGHKDWEVSLAPGAFDRDLPRASKRVRILSPFDPVVRDRKRLLRLFGFDFRIEIFVPAAHRKYGYYVFPVLEGDQFIGRIEIKADRALGLLVVLGFWPEAGVTFGTGRTARLMAELRRVARLCEVGPPTQVPGLAT